MIRNKSFYQLCREFFIAALSLLTSCLASGEGLDNEYVEEVNFLEDGFVMYGPQLRPNFHSFLARHHDEVMALPQFDSLKNFVAKGELANEFLVNFGGTPIQPENYDRWLYNSTCMPLLSRYLSKIHGLEFNKEVFDKLYEGIEDYCYNPTVRLFHTAPLLYFNMQAGEEVISLAPNLVIRRLTAQERSDLWHRAPDISSLSRDQRDYLLFAAEATNETDKHNPIYDSWEGFTDLESLLRLIIRQPVTINFAIEHQEPWFINRVIGVHLIGWSKTRLQRLMPGFTPIAFTTQHVKVLQRLWSDCVAMGNETRFALALHRFGSSYDEARIEDRLLDLWIGLEALFSQQINAELRYRISLRIAYFLGKTADARRKIFERAKESYDCRSSIVHGEPIKEDLNAITKRTENYLAASLKLCLSSRTVLSAEELETRVIEGGNL